MESIRKLKLPAWEGSSRRSSPAAAASFSAGDAFRLPAAPRSATHADGPPAAAAARGGERSVSSRRKGARGRRRGGEGLMAEFQPVLLGDRAQSTPVATCLVLVMLAARVEVADHSVCSR